MDIDLELYRHEIRVSHDPLVRLSALDVSPDRSQRTFVFLHGFGGQALQWIHQMQKFSLQNRVIALDLRGHGLSDKPSTGYDMPPPGLKGGPWVRDFVAPRGDEVEWGDVLPPRAIPRSARVFFASCGQRDYRAARQTRLVKEPRPSSGLKRKTRRGGVPQRDVRKIPVEQFKVKK